MSRRDVFAGEVSAACVRNVSSARKLFRGMTWERRCPATQTDKQTVCIGGRRYGNSACYASSGNCFAHTGS
jgi:hypothetical protein